MWPSIVEGVSCHWVNKTLHLVNDVMVEMWGGRMLCHGKGQASILGPVNKVPQDENKTKRTHMAIACSHVILVKFGAGYVIILQYIVTAVAQLFPGLPCNIIFVHILCCLYIKESFISMWYHQWWYSKSFIPIAFLFLSSACFWSFNKSSVSAFTQALFLAPITIVFTTYSSFCCFPQAWCSFVGLHSHHLPWYCKLDLGSQSTIY